MTRKIRVPSQNPRNPSRQASQRDRLTVLLRAEEPVVELPVVHEEASDEAVPVVDVVEVVLAEAATRMTMVWRPFSNIRRSDADWG
jgi:hypothetical protein